MSFTVKIAMYSLAAGKVGKPTGRPPVLRPYETAEAALRDLNDAIDRNEGAYPGEGQSVCIVMPDGRELAFDAAYTETFGEAPVKQDNMGNLYPRLARKRKVKR